MVPWPAIGLLVMVVAGCATPTTAPTPEARPSEGHDQVDGSLGIQVLGPSAATDVMHLRQAPALDVRPVPAGEPDKSPFEPGAVPASSQSLHWEAQVHGRERTLGASNWTLWVEVPDQSYTSPTGLGCDFDASLLFTSPTGSTHGFSVGCSLQPGPVAAGIRRLDWSWPGKLGVTVSENWTIALDVVADVFSLSGPPVMALTGARGFDSQWVLVGLQEPTAGSTNCTL